MKDKYKRQVSLLIRIMPSVYKIQEFAVHGGTAINLFYKNMPRYSIDIDLTYIPIMDRMSSINDINGKLLEVKNTIERTIPGITVIHRPNVLKLLCSFGDATVKIEVNGIKRGLIGDAVDKSLCDAARQEFNMGCKARIVQFSQLYGGKITAALSRQHPRDLFDCKYMNINTFDEVKDGFMLCLLSSDKPIIESLQPHEIDQSKALENQFAGMTDIPFSYDDYMSVRSKLIKLVNDNMNEEDRKFLLSFEKGEPDWNMCCAGDLSRFPSVQWKLLNISKLKESNFQKFSQGIEKLEKHFASANPMAFPSKGNLSD